MGAHIVSGIKHFVFFMFILCFFSLFTTGNLTTAIALFNPLIFGVIVYEIVSSPTVTVRAEGIVYRHRGKSRTLGFETYYFSSDTKGGLSAEDRRSHRVETLKFGGFDKKTLKDMANDIQKRQTAYYLKRNSAGEYSSGKEIREEKIPTAPSVTKAPPTPAVSDKIRTDKPQTKEKAPELKRDIPEAVPELSKTEFRYPKRDIVERAEHESVLSALVIMAAAVLAFLLWYLGIGYLKGTSDVILTALGMLAVAAVLIAVIVVSRTVKARRAFSKLELTNTHLIIDNKRFKLTELQSRSMTAPTKSTGERYLRFTYDGRSYVYNLGVCQKSGGKREMRYFSRYRELAGLLAVRGFSER